MARLKAPANNIRAKNAVIPVMSAHLREIEANYVAISPRRQEMPMFWCIHKKIGTKNVTNGMNTLGPRIIST